MNHDDGGFRPNAGCGATVIAVLAMLVVAPFAAIVRSWKQRRRGDSVEMTVDRANEGGMVELVIDSPTSRVLEVRRWATETLVRLADSVAAGDAYHMAYREPGASQSTLVPIGSQIQALGDRLHQGLSKSSWRGMRLLWLCMDRAQALAEVVSEECEDPAGPDAVAALGGDPRVRWLVVTVVEPSDVGEVTRFLYVFPPELRPKVEERITQIREKLQADGGQ